MANSLVRLWRRWKLPTAYVRVIEGEETDERARERYWREHPEQDGCRVEIIRRAFVKPEVVDPLTKQWMGKNPL
jgi:hypothetical protein